MARTELDEIDALLLSWHQRLARMDDNLVALESEPVYQTLAGKLGARPALEGATLARVGPALVAVGELFEDRGRLAAVVDEAKAVRASISALTFWESDAKIAEIRRLLRGASIDLGEAEIAIGDRSLLSTGFRDVRVVPEELLESMVRRFDEARKALGAVSIAWGSLTPEIAQIEREIQAFRAIANGVGASAEVVEIARVEADLSRLGERLARDPLGAVGVVREEIAPRVGAISIKLEAAKSAQRGAIAALDRARTAKASLDEAHARAAALDERARREIEADCVMRRPRPLDDGQVHGLAVWLAKLEATVAGRRWAPAEIGLARFEEAMADARAAEASAIRAIEALLGLPAELAGRLSARRAQAVALASRGLALGDDADREARRAASLLAQKPVPIDEAARAVEGYEARVIALSARRRGGDDGG